jgi:hypothetical protein
LNAARALAADTNLTASRPKTSTVQNWLKATSHKGDFTVMLNGGNANIAILDASGRRMLQMEVLEGQSIYPRTGLPAGVYFLLAQRRDGKRMSATMVLE